MDRNIKVFLSFLSVLTYLMAFIALNHLKAGGGAFLVVIPVLTIAWLYGWVPGLVAGIISLPVNILVHQLVGVDWYLHITKGALIEGTCALIVLGIIVGRVSELSRRLRKEMSEKENLADAIQAHRRNLEQEVQEKTGELRTAYHRLSATNQQLDANYQQLKASEAELIKANQLLESTFHASADGIIITDANGYIIRTNKALADMLGFTGAELVRKHMAELAPREEPYITLAAKLMSALQEHGIVRGFEAGLIERGGIAPVELSAVHLRDEQGNVTGFLVSVRDIKERKKAEDLLRQSAIKFQSVVETAVDAIISTNNRGEIISWNKAATDIYGYTAEEVTGKPIRILIPERLHDIDRNGMDKARQQAQPGVVNKSLESVGLRKDGTEFPTDVSQSIWRVGGETFFTGIVRDITGRKQAERTLREAEERFRSIAETTPDAIVTGDASGRVVYWNKGAEKMFGYTSEEIVGQPVAHLVAGMEDVDITAVDQFGAKFFGNTLETVCIRKNGEHFSTDTSLSSFELAGETYVTAIIRDISERKHNEEELLRLAAIVEYAEEIIFVTDLTGHFVYVNPAFERISGFSAGEIIGEHTSLQVPRNYDKAVFEDMITCIYEGKNWQGHVTKQKKDGSLYEVMAVLSPIKNAQGEVISYVSIERDITHELELERSLLQAQKMEAIGTLAGGIAHDFNNILTAAMGFTEIALMKLPEGSPAAGDLRQVLKSTERARDLVKQILAFSRKGDHVKKSVRMSEIINDSLKLIRAALPSTIDIQCTLKTTDDIILADPTQMHQIVMNLCTNAADAMQERGGTLLISLSSATIDTDEDAKHADLQKGLYCSLTVRDTGEGIDQDIIDKIFDPFFTTKEAGKGTGMGLAVVDGIVKSHNGSVRLFSEKGKGTSVQVLLPVTDSAVLPDRQAAQHASGGSERILLIDDETDVVNVTSALLTSLGYRVQSITDSTRALELVRSDPAQFDLVITDYTMPRMTGDAIAQQILKMRPDMPIILCTGYNNRISAEAARAIGIRALLMKPLNRKDLGDNIRAVLDHAR